MCLKALLNLQLNRSSLSSLNITKLFLLSSSGAGTGEKEEEEEEEKGYLSPQ